MLTLVHSHLSFCLYISISKLTNLQEGWHKFSKCNKIIMSLWLKLGTTLVYFFCFCKFASQWIRFTLNIIYISFSFNKYIINCCINILIRRNALYVLVIDFYFSTHCCYQIQNCMVVFWGRFKRIDVFLNIQIHAFVISRAIRILNTFV
jgi:hypothetical protein